ncbi:MAG: transcriptional regulator [Rhodospirillaceae bacterium]|nr:transcriptional regulator [Rhodospirillaceae bacterium]
MYHYVDSGLPNIWLVNGYVERETPYGKAVAIRDVDGLHRAIGRWIVANRPRLTGAEFRFLRKEMGLSQGALARLMGNEEQSVSLWERRGRIPVWADRFLRALYREHVEGSAQIRALVGRLNELDEGEHERLTLRHARSGWKAAAS